MKIFITGGSGLLGSKVAEISAERGYEVYSGYNAHKPNSGTPVKLDLTDSDSIKSIKEIEPDVVVHSAALTDVDRCEKEKELAYRVNVEGTRNVAEVADEVGSFMVYVSTDYVFDGKRGMYSESDEPDPINNYGYTKLLGEGYCNSVARTCVLYGARPATGKANFALWLLNKLENGEELKVVTDQYITPTLNSNLARMILEVAERGMEDVLHLSGATRVSRYEFAREVADVFGFDKGLIGKSSMDELNWFAERPIDSSLDTSKASQELSEKPYELNDALKMLRDEISI